ncbi:hypothetical protein V6N13_115961 [Hibiscus sabdariffa]
MQGCGHSKFLQTLRQYLQDNKPNVVGLVEPCISGLRANRVIASCGFPTLIALKQWDSREAFGFVGPNFTWQCGSAHTRLDHFLCNKYWDEAFPNSSISHLLRMRSDHQHVLVQVGHLPFFSFKPSFRYFTGWQLHDDFRRMILDNWRPTSSLSETIRSFTIAVEDWNNNIFGHIGTRKRILQARLRAVQRVLCTQNSSFLSNLENELFLELESLLDQEKILWRKKSCFD